MLTLLIPFFISIIVARPWTPEYIDTLLDIRSCLDSRHLAIFDSLFVPLNDTSLTRLYYATAMQTFEHRLHRNEPLCVAIEGTISHLYREVIWQKRQYMRRISESKIVVVAEHHTGREAFINYLHQVLSGGVVREVCNAIIVSDVQVNELRDCTREKRKDSIWAYTRFKE